MAMSQLVIDGTRRFLDTVVVPYSREGTCRTANQLAYLYEERPADGKDPRYKNVFGDRLYTHFRVCPDCQRHFGGAGTSGTGTSGGGGGTNGTGTRDDEPRSLEQFRELTLEWADEHVQCEPPFPAWYESNRGASKSVYGQVQSRKTALMAAMFIVSRIDDRASLLVARNYTKEGVELVEKLIRTVDAHKAFMHGHGYEDDGTWPFLTVRLAETGSNGERDARAALLAKECIVSINNAHRLAPIVRASEGLDFLVALDEADAVGFKEKNAKSTRSAIENLGALTRGRETMMVSATQNEILLGQEGLKCGEAILRVVPRHTYVSIPDFELDPLPHTTKPWAPKKAGKEDKYRSLDECDPNLKPFYERLAASPLERICALHTVQPTKAYHAEVCGRLMRRLDDFAVIRENSDGLFVSSNTFGAGVLSSGRLEARRDGKPTRHGRVVRSADGMCEVKDLSLAELLSAITDKRTRWRIAIVTGRMASRSRSYVAANYTTLQRERGFGCALTHHYYNPTDVKNLKARKVVADLIQEMRCCRDTGTDGPCTPEGARNAAFVPPVVATNKGVFEAIVKSHANMDATVRAAASNPSDRLARDLMMAPLCASRDTKFNDYKKNAATMGGERIVAVSSKRRDYTLPGRSDALGTLDDAIYDVPQRTAPEARIDEDTDFDEFLQLKPSASDEARRICARLRALLRDRRDEWVGQAQLLSNIYLDSRIKTRNKNLLWHARNNHKNIVSEDTKGLVFSKLGSGSTWYVRFN